MAAVLKITDGSEEVNLIDEQAGFILKEWIPAIPTYKNGGVFVDSPLVEGRRLVSKQFGNVTDTFKVDVREAGQDALIAQLQTLRQLLEKAANYWVTEWQTEPVWLEAQASCESNKRYAIIYMGSLPEDDNFYAQPFIGERGKAAMDDLSLVIEHGIWQDVEPGQEGNALEISSESVAPDNVTYGQEASTSGAFIVNKYAPDDQLTHIYYYDASLVAWSANLINAAVPFALTPNPTEAGDIIYFGVEDPGTGRYINFSNLIFDTGTVSTNITSYTWEYYNSTTGLWATLNVNDSSVGFTVSGITHVSWTPSASFASTARNGVTAFWVRFRIITVGGAIQRPTQQNRYIYSQVVPYLEITSTEIFGDITALVRYLMYKRSLDNTNKVIFGTRSLSRGTGFVPYLNASMLTNLPVGVTSNIGSTYTPMSPSGECQDIQNTPAAWSSGGAWVIEYPLTQQYHGRFRIFLRGRQYNGVAGDIQIKLKIFYYSDDNVIWTETGSFSSISVTQCLDLGQISLPPGGHSHLIQDDSLYFTPYYYGNGSSDFYIFDLILIPIDESFGEIVMAGASSVSSLLDFGYYYPNASSYAVVKDETSDIVYVYYQVIAPQSPFLQVRADQRIWFSLGQYSSSVWGNQPTILNKVSMQKYQRYLSARGDK